MIHRANTYPMHPTPEQSALLAQHAGVCRLVWNLALEQRQDHHRRYRAVTGESLNFVAQCRELTLLRNSFEFVRHVTRNAQERALKDLDQGYQRAFRGLGQFPKFKRKGLHEAFTIAGQYITLRRINKRWGMIKLAKVGWVKIRMPRNIVGKVTEAAVSMTASGWQVSVAYKVDGDMVDVGGAIGIDRGVAVPMMLSNGDSYALPSNLADASSRAREAQCAASRGKQGSARYAKARRRLAMVKAKEARIRKHWAHETTTTIARQFGTVVIENLRTSAMTRSGTGSLDTPGKNVAQKRGLNRAILNVGWQQIERMLAYKAYRLIKVDPRYTSQACSACGIVDKGSRKNQATFVCTACGYHGNADLNAAINILNRGNTPVVEAGASLPVKREPVAASAATIHAIGMVDVTARMKEPLTARIGLQSKRDG